MMRVALLAMPLLLAACSGLSSKAGSMVTYQLRAAPVAADAAGGAPSRLASFSVRVVSPVADPGFESDAIRISVPGRRLDQYAASRWAGPTPQVVGSLAIETLRNRQVLAAVHDDASPYAADYLLRIAIRRFDADYGSDAGGAPQATVVFDCTVGTRGERTLLRSFVARGTVRADSNRMADVVAAFEQAAQAALATVAEQSLAAMSEDAASN